MSFVWMGGGNLETLFPCQTSFNLQKNETCVFSQCMALFWTAQKTPIETLELKMCVHPPPDDSTPHEQSRTYNEAM